MSFIQLHITTDALTAEHLQQWLDEAGALAITLRDAEDDPQYQLHPSDEPLWQLLIISALFSEASDIHTIVETLKLRLEQPEKLRYSIETLPDKPWENEWVQHFKPLKITDSLWVCPQCNTPPDTAATNIMIDPGLAFGTGEHETTLLCLRWLAAQDLAGKVVVDYGCGSGILAIAACLLGAKQVVAIDHDPQAITATLQNANLNALNSDQLQVMLDTETPLIHADVVIANILAQPLISLATTLSQLTKPSGQLVLSGILVEQAPAIEKAYPAFQFNSPVTEGGWVCLTANKLTSE